MLTRRGFPLIRLAIALFFSATMATAGAGLNVGAGSYVSLGDGQLWLGGGDLDVAGVVLVGNGQIREAGSVLTSGVLNGGNGLIELFGDWVNDGDFVAGNSLVQFIDGEQAQSLLVGNTQFASLFLASSTGKTYLIESGSTLLISDTLTILGQGGIPIQVASSNPPAIAWIVLASYGTQNIDNVGVSNVHAAGQHLAPNQTNQGGSGNDLGWFGEGGLFADRFEAP